MITLTPAIFTAKGYQISNTFDQPLIDRCVKDIIAGYIAPILPTYAEDDEDVLTAVYCLTYILLLSRNAVKTRYGAKTKEVEYSKDILDHEIQQLTITADMYLSVLQAKDGAEACPDIKDVAKIYPELFLI